MNRFLKLFELRGIKIWMLVIGFGLNLVLSFFLFTGLGSWLALHSNWAQYLDIILMVGELLISGIVGFGVAMLAKDNRGPSYGILSAIGSLLLVVSLLFETGMLAIIIGLTAILGGYNGGVLAERVLYSRQG